jgi:RNA polymerase sigma-70 factor (ECF subfamily)
MGRKPDETARKMAQVRMVEREGEGRPSLDAGSLADLHRQYQERLVNSVTSFVNDRDRAEDVASQAFATVWEKRAAFRGEASLYTWLQSIARNAARSALRREPTARFESMDQEGARECAMPDRVADELERQDDRLRLQKALYRLPARHRRVLLSHFVEGLSIKQIAQRGSVPLGTVLSRMFTAKQLLRHAWQSDRSGPRADAMVERNLSPPTDKRQTSPKPPACVELAAESSQMPTMDR